MTFFSRRDRHLWVALICAALLHAPLAGAESQKPLTIVALGASNTRGWGVAPAQAYPMRLQALLQARGIDVTVLNAGVAGDTTGGMLARLERAVPAGVRLVVLQPGTNDERLGLAAERSANIADMRTRLTARNVGLIVVENAMLDELPRSELAGDGVHFTPAGYAMLAERVLPEVLKALGK